MILLSNFGDSNFTVALLRGGNPLLFSWSMQGRASQISRHHAGAC